MVRLSSILDGLERVSDSGKPGRRRALADIKAISVNDDPKIDVDKMTASARICTDVVDYQQEVILAGEVDLTNYANNGVVLYEHGDNITFDHPLGTSITPDGSLDVTLVDDFNMDATSYFADVAKQFPIVNQYFGLIDAGVIRATSIHVQPRPGSKVKYRGEDGHEITVTEASDMVEWSWCKMGVNPEALKKSFASRNRMGQAFAERLIGAASMQADRAAFVLQSGRINNEALEPSVRKSLLSIVRTSTNGNGIGHSFSEQPMSKKSLTTAQLKALSGDKLKEMHEDDQFKMYEPETAEQLKSLYARVMDEEEGGEEDEDEPDEDAEGKSDDEGDMKACDDCKEEAEEEMPVAKAKGGKPGSEALRQIYEGLNLLLKAAEEAMDPIEQPDVKGGMDEVMTQARAMSAAIDGLHAKAYGEDLAGKMEADAETQKKAMEEEDTIQSQMKAFLAGPKQVPSFQMKSFAGQLRRIANDKSVPSSARKSLTNLSVGLERLQEEAANSASAKSDMVPRAEFDSLVQSNNELEATLSRANATIEKLLPAS